jgi:mono/diheme cytochrome c family protein
MGWSGFALMRMSSGKKRFRALTALVALGSTAAFLAWKTGETPVHAAAATIAMNGVQNAAATPAAPTATPADKAGADSFAKHCAICHGEQREGILPGFPPLVGISHQLNEGQILRLIQYGKGRMPGFPKLQDPELTSLVHFLSTAPISTPVVAGPPGKGGQQLSGDAAAGQILFQQNCAFCHGRDAMGGETGPDLTQSKIVLGDKDGSSISAVVHEGRSDPKKMPAFTFSNQETMTLVAFIRARVAAAASMKGNRRGVDVSDLQTGNVEAGKKYFNGAGGCSKCHAPSGDLAGIARKYEGLRLEEQMLYPRDAKSTVVVTLPSGQEISGVLAYKDEFVIGMRDGEGSYHSWRVEDVKFKVNSPVEAHVEQFPKYTDDDVHNLMAYLQTLK